MKITGFDQHDNQVTLYTEKGKMCIQPLTEKVVRIRYTLEENFSERESLMRVPIKQERVDFKLHETTELLTIQTANLQVAVNKETSAFTYLDENGSVLAKEPSKGGKTLVAVDLIKTVFDDNTIIESGSNVDGMRSNAKNFREVIDRKSYHTKLEFDWDNEEALYGLGSHEEGMINLRGHHQYLYQQNFKAAVPFFLSTKGYGILLDSYSLITFHDDVYGSYLWSEYNDELDYYFVYGPEFDEIIHGYRKLTGQAPMLPLWAFGYMQSKERYKSQHELIDVVLEYRRRNIPLDVIVLDWLSWTGDLWGQKSFDPERFPNPKDMMGTLHELNVRLMVSIWPIMKKGGSNHAEMLEQGCLLGNQATYDAFSEKARQLYWKQAYEGIFSNGTDAWWCDCTEPFEADWNGEVRLEPEQRLNVNTGRAKRYLDGQYINAYSLQHSKGIYEGQRQATHEKRVVNLTRSAYAGQQRYSAITWSGDISANWDTLRKQIPAAIHFCASGIPYWTLDIGAFFVKKKEQWFWAGDYEAGCDDLGYRELYVRWFQQAVFLPIFRSHGTDTPREIWQFGVPGSETYDTLVRFNQLRYRLLPYIYSMAGWVTHLDYTMLRALPFDFRNDRKTYNISDQYLFGPAFLVNPVTEPMYYDQGSVPIKNARKTRWVYLPEGSRWYDFWTGECFDGGQSIEAKAALNIMPLFVREGSIIPMGPVMQYSNEKSAGEIELRIYGQYSGSFLFYEDSGDGYDYEKNQYATTQITWNSKTGEITLHERKGAFDGISLNRTFNVVQVSQGHGTGLEQTSNPDAVIHYNGSKAAVSLPVG